MAQWYSPCLGPWDLKKGSGFKPAALDQLQTFSIVITSSLNKLSHIHTSTLQHDTCTAQSQAAEGKLLTHSKTQYHVICMYVCMYASSSIQNFRC
jgi:hypothetical protein